VNRAVNRAVAVAVNRPVNRARAVNRARTVNEAGNRAALCLLFTRVLSSSLFSLYLLDLISTVFSS
jgi:hypothetical protein